MNQGIRLILAYDGSGFAGWQLQPGQRTVQGVLEQAVERVAGHAARVRAAGRTDAGVHARGQVAAFDTRRELPMRNWVLALNSNLPHDVAVRSAAPCNPGYDPRYDAAEKTYRYLLHLGPVRDPLLRDRVWHLGKLLERDLPEPDRVESSVPRLDVGAMRRAAEALAGTHDFRAFCAADDEHESTLRTVHEVALEEGFLGREDLLGIRVRGTAFLKHMVRVMAGTLVEVGRGRMTPEQVAALLADDARRRDAGETAPAWGLTLESVELGRGGTTG